jgi:hypothetical protein
MQIKHFGIKTTSNEKLVNYKVVDLIKYYNFTIKFVFNGYHMRKL